MQKKTAPSADQKALTKLSGDVILRELPEEPVIKYIAVLIDRLAKLYQMQNWGPENTVFLAEWVIETYACEMLQTIDKVLRNPPKTEDKNWRLTPDTIRAWMETELETVAMQRENWNHNKKHSDRDQTLIPIKEIEQIYERLKMPARIAELAKEDLRAELAKKNGRTEDTAKRDADYLKSTGQE